MIGIAKSGTNYHIATISDGALIFEANLSLDTVQSLLEYISGNELIRFYSLSRDGYREFKIKFPALAIKFMQPNHADIMDAIALVKQDILDGSITSSPETERLIDGLLSESATIAIDMVSRESVLYSDKQLQATAIYLASIRENGIGQFNALTESQPSNSDEWGRNE